MSDYSMRNDLVFKTNSGLVRWLSGEQHSAISLTIWIWFPGASQRKEQTNSYRLSFDLHTCVWCAHTQPLPSTHTIDKYEQILICFFWGFIFFITSGEDSKGNRFAVLLPFLVFFTHYFLSVPESRYLLWLAITVLYFLVLKNIMN